MHAQFGPSSHKMGAQPGSFNAQPTPSLQIESRLAVRSIRGWQDETPYPPRHCFAALAKAVENTDGIAEFARDPNSHREFDLNRVGLGAVHDGGGA